MSREESDSDESDTDFNFESNVGSRRYPVHDCCEFEDGESLKRLIFVRQEDSSDDNSSSGTSSSGSSSSNGESERDDEQTDDDDDPEEAANDHAAAAAAAMGHSPAVVPATERASAKEDASSPADGTQDVIMEGGETDNKVQETSASPVSTREKLQDAAASAKDDGSDNANSSSEKKEESSDNVSQKSSSPSKDTPEAKGDLDGDSKSEKQNTKCEKVENGDTTALNLNSSDKTTNENDHSNTDDRVKQETKRKKVKKKKKEPRYYCPYDLNERDLDENTPLHVAICAHKIECVKLLLKAGADIHRKSDGSAAVHTCISMGAIPAHANFAAECLSVLITRGADLAVKDESMHTPLYLSAMYGLPRCASLILHDSAGITTLNARSDRSGGRPLHACAKYDGRIPVAHHHRPMHTANSSACPAILTRMMLSTPGIEIDPTNSYGRTPLHVAASRGNWAVARLLLEQGANPTAVDHRGYTPGALAAKRGMVVPNDLLSLLGDNTNGTIEKRDLIMDPDSNTILLCHELCSRHKSCPPIIRGGVEGRDPPPENVRRLHVLLNEDTGILRCSEFRGCAWQTEARRAAMADVLKVHEYAYVEKVSLQCSSLPDHPSAIESLDADTAISHWSFEAALRAAGSVCEAVDKVMAGDHRNAFCAIRPPGHHAGPRGIVTCPNDPDGSHGFCLLNNVAVGAAYARSMYRNDGIKKVAIIDFDVHHGNGTEEIVRNLVPTIEMAAVRTPIAIGSFQTSKYRPWLDESDIKDVFFASTHGYGPRDLRFADQPNHGGWFYPASGATQVTEAVQSPTAIEDQPLSDFLHTQTWARMGESARNDCCKIIDIGLDLPRPNDIPGMQRLDLRDAYRKTILPYLMEFNPDMIFISAGFDAHKRDGMNFGYVGMIEEDYEWVTEQLVKVANSCCNGRIVSALEGGYKIHGGIVSPFARSVASHVRALVDAGISREMYSAEDLVWESRFERQMVEEKERRAREKRQMKLDRLVAAEVERRKIRAAEASLSQAGKDRQQQSGSAGVGDNDEDTMLNEPLHDGGNAVGIEAFQPPTDPNLQSRSGGETPQRKRRRNQVDYKQLYEQMKKESFPG